MLSVLSVLSETKQTEQEKKRSFTKKFPLVYRNAKLPYNLRVQLMLQSY